MSNCTNQFRGNDEAGKTTHFRGISILILLVMLCGCKQTFSNLEEYEAYINAEDAPYTQTIIKNGSKVTVRYLSTDALMLRDYHRFREMRERLAADTSLTSKKRAERIKAEQQKLTERRADYGQSLYFKLTIGHTDESKDIVFQQSQAKTGGYSQWLQKLLFGLKESIYLRTVANNEIPLNNYHMERTYGMDKNRNFLLMFPTGEMSASLPGNNNPVTLIIKEFGLGTGRLKFEFEIKPSDRFNKIENKLIP